MVYTDKERFINGTRCIIAEETFYNTAKAVIKFNKYCVGLSVHDVLNDIMDYVIEWHCRDTTPGYSATGGWVISRCINDEGIMYYYASVWNELFRDLEV